MTAHEERTLRIVATMCGGGGCPTVYLTDRGSLVIQGALISGEAAGIDVPAGEALVEIPAELLNDLKGEAA